MPLDECAGSDSGFAQKRVGSVGIAAGLASALVLEPSRRRQNSRVQTRCEADFLTGAAGGKDSQIFLVRCALG